MRLTINLSSLVCGILAIILTGGTFAPAAIITVDGNPSDWGFTVADNNLSTFVPASGLNLLGLFVEDQNDHGDEFFVLGPGWGGQNYDSEAMAATIQGGTLYLIIVTGQRPDNGFQDYAPGDIHIRTTTTDYGIEVGGGAGGGAGGVLNTGAVGSTYTLDGNGLTTQYHNAAASHTVGSVWRNPTWVTSPQFDWLQPQMYGGTLAGTAQLVYTRNSTTTQHAIIELGVPLSTFSGTITDISWFPSCGNNVASISGIPAPEPSTAFLAVLAAMSIALVPHLRRTKRMS